MLRTWIRNTPSFLPEDKKRHASIEIELERVRRHARPSIRSLLVYTRYSIYTYMHMYSWSAQRNKRPESNCKTPFVYTCNYYVCGAVDGGDNYSDVYLPLRLVEVRTIITSLRHGMWGYIIRVSVGTCQTRRVPPSRLSDLATTGIVLFLILRKHLFKSYPEIGKCFRYGQTYTLFWLSTKMS